MTTPHTGPIAQATVARSEGGYDVLSFGNEFWLLKADLGPAINPRELTHLKTGHVLADENYCYEVDLADASDQKTGFNAGAPSARAARLIEWRVAENAEAGSATLTIVGRLDFGRAGPTDIIIEHSFTVFAGKDQFDEQISLVHRYGHDSHIVDKYRFAFRKRMFDAATAAWLGHADDYRLGAIPFRRRRGQAKDFLKEDYSAADLVPANWDGNNLPDRQSEAWSWQNGSTGFCFAKYTQDHIEFALVDGEFYTRPSVAAASGLTWRAAVGDVCLRFGGAGRTNGAPGMPVMIDAKQRVFRFGTSTIFPFEGGWEDGHRAYGAFLRERGHVVPKGFNPPVHWNELYALSWRGGTNAPLQELPELYAEADNARKMGAEAFYFDPVWDIFEGSSIWDEARLGPLSVFVSRMKSEYGLSTSLHLMMNTKSVEDDPRIFRRDKQGEIIPWNSRHYTGGYACCATKAWQDIKTERLLTLARAGVEFFMFDFCEYAIDGTKAGVHNLSECEPCWNPTHGHAVPMQLEEHSDGLINVMRRVKQEFPNLIIEAHDRIAAGAQDYLPLYYEHNVGGLTFDEHWGFEFMWNPYMDLLSGKSLSLYEYNLAYDIPLYLHINLRFDNDNALAFWWYASTCRHLGIGGLKPGDAIWDSHVAAMKTYRRLKPHFTAGRFVGLDLNVHGHVLDDGKSAVIVAFNQSSTDKAFAHSFALSDLGLSGAVRSTSSGASIADGRVTLSGDMKGLSALVFELSLT